MYLKWKLKATVRSTLFFLAENCIFVSKLWLLLIILWKMKTNPIHVTFYAKWSKRKLFTRLYHFRFEYPLSILQIFSINIRGNTQYLLVNEIWRPRPRTPCLRSCPGARSRACGGWGMRGAFEGFDNHSPSLCLQRTRNDDLQLSKGRFEQLRERLFGKWPLTAASNVWFETARHPFHSFRRFAIPTEK